MTTSVRKAEHRMSANAPAWIERLPRPVVIAALALMSWVALAATVMGLFETWKFVSGIVLGG